MSFGFLILVLWLTAAAAYLIWQFATDSLGGGDPTESEGRTPLRFAAKPHGVRRASGRSGRLIPIPVTSRRKIGRPTDRSSLQ